MKKMLRRTIYIACFLTLVAFHWGCTGLRSLGEGQHLYAGCIVNIDSAKLMSSPKVFKAEVKELIPVKPNLKVFWMRPLLSFHQFLPKPKKETGFWHYLKYRIGEAPAHIAEEHGLMSRAAADH